MTKINEKANTRLNIKIYLIFIITKKVILNLIVRIKTNRLFISPSLREKTIRLRNRLKSEIEKTKNKDNLFYYDEKMNYKLR